MNRHRDASIPTKTSSRPMLVLFYKSKDENENKIERLFQGLESDCLFLSVDLNSQECFKIGIDVRETPALCLVRHGEIEHLFTGTDPVSIRNRIESISERYLELKSLTSKSGLMLFIKGTPEEPKCKFTRRILEVVNKLDVAYSTFDILSSSEVREGLKKHSNWKTYPQVYFKGNLIGGLDTLTELVEKEEFRTLIEEELK